MKKNLLKLLALLLTLVLTLSLVACHKEDKHDHDHEHEEEHDHDHEHEDEEHDHDHAHDHVHGEFEWIGEFEFTKGEYLLHFGASPDETMRVGFVKLGDNITDLEHHASHLMAVEGEKVENDSSFEAKPDYTYELQMDPEHGHFHFNIGEDGRYAIITEHLPSENNLQVFDKDKNELVPEKEHEFDHHHDHDHDHEHDEDHDHENDE